MKLNLKFTPDDFRDFKSFEKSIQKQLGNTVYVGADSLTFWFRYPKELSEKLRPGTPTSQLEFELTSEQPDKKKN